MGHAYSPPLFRAWLVTSHAKDHEISGVFFVEQSLIHGGELQEGGSEYLFSPEDRFLNKWE